MNQRTTAGTCGLFRTPQSRYLRDEMLVPAAPHRLVIPTQRKSHGQAAAREARPVRVWGPVARQAIHRRAKPAATA
jgi:hypothetical protein